MKMRWMGFVAFWLVAVALVATNRQLSLFAQEPHQALDYSLYLPEIVAKEEPRINEFNLEPVGHVGGSAYAIAIQGNLVYTSINHDFTILDVTDHRHPRKLGAVGLPAVGWGIALRGQYAFVAENELAVIDISHPSEPRL